MGEWKSASRLSRNGDGWGGCSLAPAPANGEGSEGTYWPWRSTNFVMSTLCIHLTPRRISIHCRLPPHPQPSARRPLHDALPNDRLPGRAACSPPAGRPPGPAPWTRCPSFRLLPVPVRRGQGRQVCQQRLCRPYDDSGSRIQGWYPLPAIAWPDRGPGQLRFPGTPLNMHHRTHTARLTLN